METKVVLTLWRSKAVKRKGCCLHSNISIRSSRWMNMSRTWTTTVIGSRKEGHKHLSKISRGRKSLIRSFMHCYSHIFYCCHVRCVTKNVFNSRRLEITKWIAPPPVTCPLNVFVSLPQTPRRALFHQACLRAQRLVLQLDQWGSQHCKTFCPLPVQPLTDLMLCTCSIFPEVFGCTAQQWWRSGQNPRVTSFFLCSVVWGRSWHTASNTWIYSLCDCNNQKQ